VPTSGAILYRNFIAGAGTRAIAVGYPERAHLAFDANDLRIALLWQGAFIDAGLHWSDRGAGFQGPLGDNVLRLHPGAPFAVLAKPDSPWPAGSSRSQGWRFRGYRLTKDDRPTFLYSLGGLEVQDFPNPVTVGKEVGMRRTLSLAATGVAGLYYRAAVANRIEPLANGSYRIDDAWNLKVEGAGKPQVRRSGGKQELLVPVPFQGGKARLVVEYVW
jgi:hypothetical protein